MATVASRSLMASKPIALPKTSSDAIFSQLRDASKRRPQSWSRASWRPQSCGYASACSSSSSAAASLPPVYVSHIPHLVPYSLGLALQEAVYNLRGSPEVVFLLEHKPVYTEGRRGPENGQEDIVRQRLQAIGADYHLTQRGGLITYHGPGQLVGYPILHLGRMELSSRCYVDRLQDSLISTLRSYTLPTVPPPEDHTGVWSDSNHKIVSIGVQVRHRITTHGFALNVTREVDPWFRRIVACGIKGKSMTSMQEQLALRIQQEEDQRPDREAAPAGDQRLEQAEMEQTSHAETVVGPEAGQLINIQQVAPKVADALAKTLKRDFVPADENLLRYEADENNVLTRVWLKGEEIKR